MPWPPWNPSAVSPTSETPGLCPGPPFSTLWPRQQGNHQFTLSFLGIVVLPCLKSNGYKPVSNAVSEFLVVSGGGVNPVPATSFESLNRGEHVSCSGTYHSCWCFSVGGRGWILESGLSFDWSVELSACEPLRESSGGHGSQPGSCTDRSSWNHGY